VVSNITVARNECSSGVYSVHGGELSGADIELFRDGSRLDGHPVAALLRF
jgi:hypothetical protein